MEVGGCTTCTGLRAQIQHVLTRPERKDRKGYMGLSHNAYSEGTSTGIHFVISFIVNNTTTLALLLSVDRSLPPPLPASLPLVCL